MRYSKYKQDETPGYIKRNKEIDKLLEYVNTINSGKVVIKIQDNKIVQLEKSEKTKISEG